MAISSGIKVPGTYIEISNERAINPFQTEPFRVCILGEHYTDNAVVQAAGPSFERVYSTNDALLKYGKSPTSEMVRTFLENKKIGVPVELYAISRPSDEETGFPAIVTKSISIEFPTGMVAGNLTAYLSGKKVTITVPSYSSTPTNAQLATFVGTIATALNDVIPSTSFLHAIQLAGTKPTGTDNAIAARSIVSLSANFIEGGSVDAGGQKFIIETYNNGPILKVLDVIEDIGTPGAAATDVGLKASVALENAAGGGTPEVIDLSDYVAALPDIKVDLFINPYIDGTDTTNYQIMKTEIDRRFDPTTALEGHQICAFDGSFSALVAKVDGFNDPHLTIWDAGYNRPTPSYLQASALAGICASSLSEDPAMPMMDIQLVGVLPEKTSEFRTFDELNALVSSPLGAAIGYVDRLGNVRTKRICTTSTLTSNGLFTDYSYLDIQTPFTSSYLRQSVKRYIAVKYPNFKLANDGTPVAAGQKIATPSQIKGSILAWFLGMQELGLVEGFEQFKQELSVVRSATDVTRVDAVLPPDLINQFRIFAGSLQFIL